jgi:regulator of sigma E protease
LNLKSITLAPNYNFKDFSVGNIQKDSPANKAGIDFNDKIVSINSNKVADYFEFRKQLSLIKANQNLKLEVSRNNQIVLINAQLDKNGKLGIGFKDDTENKFTIRNKMPFTKALPEAIAQTWRMFEYNINTFKLILKPKTGAYTQVQSPIGIARRLPNEWSWEFIWEFIAMFSVGLAFMNLLPIPGLDGGHALFTIAEMITGKTLSDKAAERVQTIGMIILLSLMALTFGKDILQLVVDIFLKK